MSFEAELSQKTELVNAYLSQEVRFTDMAQKPLFDAMTYSLFAGGKRIRPVLACACAEAAGGKAEDALPFGCAIEMIHTYSLIHDDLPAMDNDDYRRGKPTNHKVFGEATAILAGDALLNYAVEFALSRGEAHPNLVPILKAITTASGAFGMIGGQMVDLLSEGKSIDGVQLTYIHERKTGALIEASCRVGALSAGREATLFDAYAAALGLAFQIKDDILDAEGDEKLLGKAVGSDEKNQKATYVSLYGMERAKQMLAEETERATEALQPLGERGAFLKDFAAYLLARQK